MNVDKIYSTLHLNEKLLAKTFAPFLTVFQSGFGVLGIERSPSSQDQKWILLAILSACISLVIFGVASILTFISRKLSGPRIKRDIVLLIGCSGIDDAPGVGKTALYSLLKHGRLPKFGLVTSVDINEGNFVPRLRSDQFSQKVTLVDFPNHSQLQYRLGHFVSRAKCVIHIMDATVGFNHIQRDAHIVLNVLTACPKDKYPGYLLFINKTDLESCVNINDIRSKLQVEIDRAWKSSLSSVDTMQMNDSDTRKNLVLLQDLCPLGNFTWDSVLENVCFSSGSVHEKKIQPVVDFLLNEFH